ncbi:MAG: peptidoglycan DD-metalloendopeptidase family protein [Flavobacteriaceae bacterium]|nr:peptidoglycan DD-metalloendopeptidase family protein [Flavobacteriaceae bacterium]
MNQLKPSLYKFLFSLIFMACLTSLEAQSKKQLELENRRQGILREIAQIETLLTQDKKTQKSILSTVEALDYKSAVRQNLINVTNQQANLLTREINANQNNITSLRDKLKVLKEGYAAMVVKSYKSKSEQSKVMFLLSSSNFQQAYKRLQYIKQYADYQKKQGEEIKLQTVKLQKLNTDLMKQKQNKEQLIKENTIAKEILQKERKEHEGLMASIRQNLSTYTAQIRTKQQEADKINKQIQKLIRDAIAASNKKAGKSSSSTTFALTSEGKALAASFTSNKGKLPWPVVSGLVKVRYGTQRSPIDRSIPINSNGVRIATNKGEKVRAVFEGVVFQIMTPKNGNNAIMIKHGNYITVYKNLSKLYVRKGQKVSTKQDIGEVITNKASGESILSFVIFKDSKTQNPAHWIYNMR